MNKQDDHADRNLMHGSTSRMLVLYCFCSISKDDGHTHTKSSRNSRRFCFSFFRIDRSPIKPSQTDAASCAQPKLSNKTCAFLHCC